MTGAFCLHWPLSHLVFAVDVAQVHLAQQLVVRRTSQSPAYLAQRLKQNSGSARPFEKNIARFAEY